MLHIIIEGANLITLCDHALDKIEKEHEDLKLQLDSLKSGKRNSIFYCVVHMIFTDTDSDLFALINSLDTLIDKTPQSNMVEVLQDKRQELISLQEQNSLLLKEFQPYIYCPAQNKPES